MAAADSASVSDVTARERLNVDRRWLTTLWLHNNMQSPPFYAVSLPKDTDSDLVELVFSDKKNAIDCCKKYKNSRFKAFPTLEDAVAFSKEQVDLTEQPLQSPCRQAQEVERLTSPHHSPKTQDLTKLRRAIERGDCNTVNELIDLNPRYLISAGDTPVILMEGPRYNALHCAAKSGQTEVMKLILDKISDVNFIKFMYPRDSEEVAKDRIDFVLDLYLNTPDKGASETPLHFACKFGSVGVVKLLLDKSCDTTLRNKLNQTAREVICDRKGDAKIKEQINQLFDAKRKRICGSPLIEMSSLEESLQRLTLRTRLFHN